MEFMDSLLLEGGWLVSLTSNQAIIHQYDETCEMMVISTKTKSKRGKIQYQRSG